MLLKNSHPIARIVGIAALLFATIPGAVHAQSPEPPTKAAPVVATDLSKNITAVRLQQVPLREAALQLTKATGITIAVDAGLKPITLIANSGTLAEAVAFLAKQLPPGTSARFVAVPAGDPMPTAEQISAYLLSQDGLRRKTAPKLWEAATNEIEVLGRPLAAEKAAPLMEQLELKPVYVISAGRGDALVARAGMLQSEGLQLWQEMTTEQRAAFMENQLNGLLNMDSPSRQAMFQQFSQMGPQMMQKIQSLPADQRAQFWKDMTGGRFDGTMPPPRPGTPPGPGGNGGGGQ
jgi:hypothetical protein